MKRDGKVRHDLTRGLESHECEIRLTFTLYCSRLIVLSRERLELPRNSLDS